MDIYDQYGHIIDPTHTDLADHDYSLIIDFEQESFKGCESILEILYKCSSLCQKDIIILANHVINNLLIVRYDIINPEYRDLVQLIHVLFKILQRIKNKTEMMIIHELFNTFIKPKPISNPSSPVSPPPTSSAPPSSTPTSSAPPSSTQPPVIKIMKKFKKNK